LKRKRHVGAPLPRAFCRAELVVRLLRGRARTFSDVGCGEGYLAERLARAGLTGWGIDPSADAVALAQERFERMNLDGVRFWQSDLFDPKLPRAEADAVLLLEVLEHLEDDTGALERLRDLVKDEGYLVLSVPAHQKLWDHSDEAVGHVRRYERKELLGKLETAGWAPQLVYNYGFPLINLMRPLRAVFHRQRQEKAGFSDAHEATLYSGIHEAGHSSRLAVPLALYGRLASTVQRPFLRTDLGEGYLTLAEKQPVRRQPGIPRYHPST
jgi:SAM-dependent methyltransferase